MSSGKLIGIPWSGSINPGDFEAIAQTVIDAQSGSVDRYREVRENCNHLIEELGTGTFVNGRTTEPYAADLVDSEDGVSPGTVAIGKNVIVDGPETTIRHVWVHENEDDVDMDAADELVENWRLTENLEDISTERRGRVLTTEGSRRTGEYGLFRYIN